MYRSLTLIKVAALLSISVFFVISCSGKDNPIAPGDTDRANFINDSSQQNDAFAGQPVQSKLDPVYNSIYNTDDNYEQDVVLITLKPGVIQSGTSTKLANLAARQGLALNEIVRLSWGTVFKMDIIDGTPVTAK